MNDMTVSEVSKAYGVSTRMLRYYEKEGLIASKHKDDYAYRIYDAAAIRRLKQVLLLRKLRFLLKDIQKLLDLADQSETLAVFLKHIAELENEIAAIRVIKDVLQELVNGGAQRPLVYLENGHMQQVMAELPLSKSTLKEKQTMEEIDEANAALEKAQNVRILLLPSMTVAAYQYVGPEPEQQAGDVMSAYIRESRLYERKPDARMFGFNHPNPAQPGDEYGYEVWVTIPEGTDLPEPLRQKQFPGGLFAVLTIDFPEFWRWQSLFDWVQQSERYEINFHPLGEEIMGGCLEEHLNWVYSVHMGWPKNGIDGKLAHTLTVGHEMDDVAVGPHSPFMLLPMYGGKILFIGDILHSCTFMHGIEEILQPPYIRRVKHRYVVNGTEREYFDNDDFGWGSEFQRIEEILTDPDIRKGPLGGANGYLIDARALLAAGLVKMWAEPYSFVTDISKWC